MSSVLCMESTPADLSGENLPINAAEMFAQTAFGYVPNTGVLLPIIYSVLYSDKNGVTDMYTTTRITIIARIVRSGLCRNCDSMVACSPR